jgi:hypothetical protein
LVASGLFCLFRCVIHEGPAQCRVPFAATRINWNGADIVTIDTFFSNDRFDLAGKCNLAPQTVNRQ